MPHASRRMPEAPTTPHPGGLPHRTPHTAHDSCPHPCALPESRPPLPRKRRHSRREAGLERRGPRSAGRAAATSLSLLGSARDAVLEMDPDGLITSWNASAELMLGWSAAEAVGQRMCELIVPHAHRAAHEAGLAAYLKTGQARTIQRLLEVEALHKSGSLLLRRAVDLHRPRARRGRQGRLRRIHPRHLGPPRRRAATPACRRSATAPSSSTSTTAWW
jgi:PAS domain S-box-containing protein